MSGLLYKSRAKNTATVLPDASGAMTINQANIKNIQSGLDVANNIVQNQINKEYEIQYNTFAINASNTLQTSMKNLFNNYRSNPETLDAEFKKVKDDIVNRIEDQNIKVSVTKDYLTLRDGYLFKANENKKIRIDRDAKESVLKSANDLAEPLSLFYEKMYNGELNERDMTDYKYQLYKLNAGLNAKGSQKDAIGEYVNLFNENEIKEIKKGFDEIKLRSGFQYFNNLFENNKEKFLEEINRWNKEPSTIQTQYGLNQEEYIKLKKYINGLGETTKNKNVKNSAEGIELNQSILEIENNLEMLKTQEGIKNKNEFYKNNANETLIQISKIDNMIEEASRLGLKDKDYIKYKTDINKYLMKFSNQVKNTETYDNDLGFASFNKKTVFTEGLDFLDNDMAKNSTLYDRTNYTMKFLKELTKTGIDVNSTNIKDIEMSKRLAKDIVDGIYDIPDNIPQDKRQELIAQKKMERQNKINEQYINEVSQYKNFNNIDNINDISILNTEKPLNKQSGSNYLESLHEELKNIESNIKSTERYQKDIAELTKLGLTDNEAEQYMQKEINEKIKALNNQINEAETFEKYKDIRNKILKTSADVGMGILYGANEIAKHTFDMVLNPIEQGIKLFNKTRVDIIKKQLKENK